MTRREYYIRLIVNDVLINKLIIDSHYEHKHAESINDALIKELVKRLDDHYFEPDDVSGAYRYFVSDMMYLNGKKYKLIWLLEDGHNYIGVINVFRRS